MREGLHNSSRVYVFRVKCLPLIALMAFSCQEDPYQDIYGRWKFYKHTPVRAMLSMDQEKTDKMVEYLIGKEVTLAKNHIIIDQIRYEKPIYEISEANLKEYLVWDYRISSPPTDLGIKKDVKNVKILNIYTGKKEIQNCPQIDSPFQESVGFLFYFNDIILYEGELLLCFDAEFFHLKKIGSR